jgi:hypothetical protein
MTAAMIPATPAAEPIWRAEAPLLALLEDAAAPPEADGDADPEADWDPVMLAPDWDAPDADPDALSHQL